MSCQHPRAAPCKNEAQQRQDHTWYKYPGSFVDELSSFCWSPKIMATVARHASPGHGSCAFTWHGNALRHVPAWFQRVLNLTRESKNESLIKPSTNHQPELSRLAEPNLPMSCLLWKVNPRQSLPPKAKGRVRKKCQNRRKKMQKEHASAFHRLSKSFCLLVFFCPWYSSVAHYVVESKDSKVQVVQFHINCKSASPNQELFPLVQFQNYQTGTWYNLFMYIILHTVNPGPKKPWAA